MKVFSIEATPFFPETITRYKYVMICGKSKGEKAGLLDF
jgi:hypothetical protein